MKRLSQLPAPFWTPGPHSAEELLLSWRCSVSKRCPGDSSFRGDACQKEVVAVTVAKDDMGARMVSRNANVRP